MASSAQERFNQYLWLSLEQTSTDILNDLDTKYPHLKHLWVASSDIQKIKFINKIRPFLEQRGYWSDYLAWAQEGQFILKRLGWRQQEATLLSNMGVMADGLNDRQQALQYYEASKRLFEKLEDSDGLAIVLHNLGTLHTQLGHQQIALKYHQQARAAFEASENMASAALSLGSMAGIYGDQGDWELAITLYERALTLLEKDENQPIRATLLNNLGEAKLYTEDYASAFQTYTASLKISEALGDEPNIATSYSNLGSLHDAQQQHEQALDFYHKALTLREELGEPDGIANTLNNIGNTFDILGEDGRALAIYERALDLYQKVGDPLPLARLWGNIGTCHANQRQWDAALEAYSKSLKIREQFQDLVGQGKILHHIGWVYTKLDESHKALTYFESALNVLDTLPPSEILGLVQYEIGVVFEQVSAEQSCFFHQKALGTFRQIDDEAGISQALNGLGNTYMAHEQWQDAIDCFEEALTIDRANNDAKAQAIVLYNLGSVYDFWDKSQKAKVAYQQSLDLYGLEAPWGLLHDLGMVLHYSLGEHEAALPLFQQALTMATDPIDRASLLGDLGSVWQSLNQLSQAQNYLEKAYFEFIELGDSDSAEIIKTSLMKLTDNE